MPREEGDERLEYIVLISLCWVLYTKYSELG